MGRQSYYRILSPLAKQRMDDGQCPNCGKLKSEWKRRTDWTCCSVECTDNYYKEHDKSYSWETVRYEIFKRDGGKCTKCGKIFLIPGITVDFKPDVSKLIADHIIPIELGGGMWDRDNIQTLCIECNKVKTREDMAHIAVHRQRFKKKLSRKDHSGLLNISLLEKWF